MAKTTKKYDLEDRTFAFAQQVRRFVEGLPKSLANTEDVRQLVRSSGSAGANYIEANEAFSKKDFVMRVKICRKEAKESRYWLKLLDTANNTILEAERKALEGEASELTHIFGAIVTKSK